jgi:hypothetical protein
VGEPIVRDMSTDQTGFVTSFLARVRGAGSSFPIKVFIDLNEQGGQQSALPVTQPTDVVVYGSGLNNHTRVFVTGFASDTIAVLEPKVGAWGISRIDVMHPTNGFAGDNLGGVMRGPRGLAVAWSGSYPDPGARVFVLNRIEHSITVLDPNFPPTNPNAAIVTTFPLQHDPTPAYIKDGRKFLYSSKLSGSGNASCATCHVDGNTDFLAWNLSNGQPVPAPDAGGLPGALGPNPAIKGPMTTQPLRGLVNFEVEDPADQDAFFSNRPYHWRGDRGFFTDFNAAFVNLMGIAAPYHIDPDPVRNKGIPDAEMAAFARFVNSIHYPPNGEQPLDRRYSGSLGNPNELDGSGAQRGLKLYHTGAPPMGTLTCVSCHPLPDGSNNMLTDAFFYFGSTLDKQTLETAQVRGMAVKEKRLFRIGPADQLVPVPAGSGGVPLAEFGLIHTGLTTMIFNQNDPAPLPFLSDTVLGFVGGFGMSTADTNDVALFVRQLDTGVAPIVGRAFTVDEPAMGDPGAVAAALDLMEGQVLAANAGLAVHARICDTLRGYYFDLGNTNYPYVEELQPGLPPLGRFSRAELLAFVAPSTGDPDNLLVFQSTALGSERRIAYVLGGLPADLPTNTPSGIVLLAMRPSTAHVGIGGMTRNWLDGFFDGRFNTLTNNKSIVYCQISLLQHAASAVPSSFGLTAARPDAPRRFVVKGSAIQRGAWLRLYAPTASDEATATETTPPTTTPSPSTHPLALELPLHPARDAGGQLVWQTDVELESRFVYALLNGGPNNPVVLLALQEPNDPSLVQIPTTDLMQPLRWNWWYVEVMNDRDDPAKTGIGGWQRLTVD